MEEKTPLLNNLKFVLVCKFSHGRPQFSTIKQFFAGLKLQENLLSLYLFDTLSLLSIANAIGTPLRVHPLNVSRVKLNSALICVELDVNKPFMNSIFICFEDNHSDGLLDGFWVVVYYDVVPSFCSSCFHLGHRVEVYKKMTSVSSAVHVQFGQRQGKAKSVDEVFDVAPQPSQPSHPTTSSLRSHDKQGRKVKHSQVWTEKRGFSAHCSLQQNTSTTASNSGPKFEGSLQGVVATLNEFATTFDSADMSCLGPNTVLEQFVSAEMVQSEGQSVVTSTACVNVEGHDQVAATHMKQHGQLFQDQYIRTKTSLELEDYNLVAKDVAPALEAAQPCINEVQSEQPIIQLVEQIGVVQNGLQVGVSSETSEGHHLLQSNVTDPIGDQLGQQIEIIGGQETRTVVSKIGTNYGRERLEQTKQIE
ncbi:hypothetical protein LIER_34854 [Lithospermum erythrorhizon]|uniref:Uncharacterized protein n=1 Tax=Lithospermum erythrorhizon TaxID=34254 RepID=A0AAV3S0M2_LITER